MHKSGVLVRWVGVISAVFFLLLCGLPIAYAAPDQTEQAKPTTWERCLENEREQQAALQMIDDGLVDGRKRTVIMGDNIVAEARQADKEEFDKRVSDNEHGEEWKKNGLRVLQGADCTLLYPFMKAGDKIKESRFWGEPIGRFVKAVMEGNTETLQMAMTFWMDFSSTSLGGSDIAANTRGIRNIVAFAAGFALVASFIYGGLRIAASRRSGLQDGLEESGGLVGRWIIWSAGIPMMVPGALYVSDMLADGIMKQFGAAPEDFVQISSLSQNFGGPIVMLILAGIMLVGSVMQLIALVIRVLLVPIIAGLAPLMAALSFTEMGRNGLGHLLAWLIAAIAFKPVSALLYVVVVWNMQNTSAGDSLTTGVINALMLGIAGIIAPTLVRILVPATSAAGGASATSGIAAAGAAVGAFGGMAGMAGSAMGAGARGVSGAAGGPGAAGAPGSSSVGAGASVSGGSGGHSASGGPSGGAGAAVASGARSVGGKVASGVRGVAGAAGTVARGAAQVTGAVGRGVEKGSQGIAQAGRLFDESVGVSGGYAGQIQR